MEEQLRILVALGLVLILVLLRLDSRRFGVAEYDVPDEYGDRPPLLPRLAWYLAGMILAVAVYVVHPGEKGVLGLAPPDHPGVVLMGIGVGAFGIAQAVLIAYVRFGGVQLPRPRAWPDGIVNAVGTALVDEATFRGIILGLLLAVGVDPLIAIPVQAIAYVLATRVGRTGADWYLVVLDLAIGLVGGWLTWVTGGIAAAVVAHAITRLAVFVATGSADAGRSWEDLVGETTGADWEYTDEDEEAYVDDATVALVTPASWSRPMETGVAVAAAPRDLPAATIDGGDDDSDASLP